MGSALRTAGPAVPLESVEWLPEASTRETPEDVLIAREEEDDEDHDEVAPDSGAIRELAADTLREYLARIPPREALALMLHLGILGYPATPQDEIAEVLCVSSQQVVSYMVKRARARLAYLASRPVVDVAALAGALSPTQLEVVRGVYETASFTAVARRRWACPSEHTPRQRHAWNRTHANRIKREFFRALAKVERRPELAAQRAALVHLARHLGSLSHHTGKGSWTR